MPQHLQRISMPPVEAFIERYMATRTPVVVTNLFAEEPVRALDSLTAAMRVLGNVRVTIEPEYVWAAAHRPGSQPRITTLADAHATMSAAPDQHLVCTEQPIPAKLMERFHTPAVCRLSCPSSGTEILSLPRPLEHDMRTNFFFAAAGSVAHMHFDGDHRHVLLYQVFGRKEIILVPPRGGRYLRPTDSLVGFAGVHIEALPAGERESLLEKAGAVVGVIEAGEALYMPPLMWHFVRYVDDAMSLNFRFGRNRYGRFLSADNFHRDYYVQNLGSLFTSEQGAEEYVPYVEALADLFARPAPGRLHKVRPMRALLRELCLKAFPDDGIEAYCPAEREQAELEKILREAGATECYTDVQTLRTKRAVRPISVAQREEIDRRAPQLGYTEDALRQLLSNAVGKSAVGALTQAEAAMVLSYMQSPSASLRN